MAADEQPQRAKPRPQRTPRRTGPTVQLVILPRGGLAGAYVDSPDLADTLARAMGAVIVELPATHDYRTKENAQP